MAVTIDQIVDAVATFLTAVTALKVVETYDAMSEDFPQYPMAQVYLTDLDTDSFTENDRTTFGAVGRVTQVTVKVDVPCNVRSHLRDDMKATLDTLDAVQTKLETIARQPYFNLAGIKAVRWRMALARFERGSSQYVGFEVFVTVRIW